MSERPNLALVVNAAPPVAPTPPRTPPAVRAPLFLTAVVITLAWGVFSFGGVYPWAYWPLLAASATIGLAGLVSASARTPFPGRALTTGLVLLHGGVLLQLVPLPRSVLSAVSPSTDAFLREYAIGFATPLSGAHALSIDPASTWLAFACLASFTLLLIGIARRLGRRDIRRLSGALVVLGAAVALEGLVQRAVSPHAIYGFWDPTGQDAAYFGPFVNRNHFAGWMLMALPVALGYMADAAANSLAGVPRRWRHRLDWLSSKDGSMMVLAGAAALLMAMALFVTLSRSGITAISVALCAGAFLRHPTRIRRSRGALLVIGALLIATVAWVGGDRLLTRFRAPVGVGLGGRIGAWQDAVAVAARFPIAGTGINTFGTAMLQHQAHNPDKWYTAAHNDYVHIAAEGGLIVGVPVLLVLGALVLEVRRRFRQDDASTFWIRAGAVTGLLAIGIQEAADFSLQIPGNAVLFAVVVAIAIHRAPARPATTAQAKPTRRPSEHLRDA